MNPLHALAEFVQSPELSSPPFERFDRVKRHAIDCVGARLAGLQTDEGVAVERLARSLGNGLHADVMAGCAQTRCTEVDDIHLTSCTTPGSVVVSTALALASEGVLPTVEAFVAATLAGYELMIRLGVAIDGPSILHRSIWPTRYAAAFGSAATTSRAYALTVDQTASALSTALACSVGTPLSANVARSARWLTLGVAAANGVAAAQGAREGLCGSLAPASAPAGVAVSFPKLTRGLGRVYCVDDVGMKPYPTARQGLAAIEASRDLVRDHALDVPAVDAIVVNLPERQRAIVNRPAPPRSRFESILSLQYQIALALLEPDRLADVRRTPPFVDDRVRRLMAKIQVRRARDLDGQYPGTWPARVEIKSCGRRLSRLVRHPRGDSRNPFDWADVTRKFRSHASPAIGGDAAEQIVDEWRGATAATPMPSLTPQGRLSRRQTRSW